MEAITAAIAKGLEIMFSKPENLALLFSFAANVAMAWFIVTTRKEDRLDRQAITVALTTMTEAINKMRIVVAAALQQSDV